MMSLFRKKADQSQGSRSFSKEDMKKILTAESPFIVKEAYSAI